MVRAVSTVSVTSIVSMVKRGSFGPGRSSWGKSGGAGAEADTRQSGVGVGWNGVVGWWGSGGVRRLARARAHSIRRPGGRLLSCGGLVWPLEQGAAAAITRTGGRRRRRRCGRRRGRGVAASLLVLVEEGVDALNRVALLIDRGRAVCHFFLPLPKCLHYVLRHGRGGVG